MTAWAYAGRLLTVLIMGWGIAEIVLSILWLRKRQRIESDEKLKRMIDHFTAKNGERYEDEWEREA